MNDGSNELKLAMTHIRNFVCAYSNENCRKNLGTLYEAIEQKSAQDKLTNVDDEVILDFLECLEELLPAVIKVHESSWRKLVN